ncbi:MAG TPA: hypothetical protein VFI13_00265 [Gemmatimonadales bacterium]|nr:hypothetical protein [Gemmatimonadales bacterium]
MRSLPLLLLLVAACGKPAADDGRDKVRHAPTPSDPALADATELGRELFGVMDRVMAYKSSHFGNLPRSLPAMGEDSLARLTIRRLAVDGDVPTLTVVYRHPEGHALTGCTGTNKVLEDSMLNGGPYQVTCTLAAGGTKAFTVGG